MVLGQATQSDTRGDHGREPFELLPSTIAPAGELSHTDDRGLERRLLGSGGYDELGNPLGLRVPITDCESRFPDEVLWDHIGHVKSLEIYSLSANAYKLTKILTPEESRRSSEDEVRRSALSVPESKLKEATQATKVVLVPRERHDKVDRPPYYRS